MKNLIPVLILAASQVLAVEQVTIDLTVTNIPQTGTNFVLNSDTRIWTNAYSSDTILTNLTTTAGAATNLFYSLSAYRHADLDYVYQTGTNTIRMWGKSGVAMTVGDAATNWASWVYTTNTETKAYNIRVPHTVEAATNQTNFASQLVSYLGKASNAFLKHWPAMAQFPSLTNNNQFTGTNVFVNSHSTNQNIVMAKGISGTLGALTNGVLTNAILVNPTSSNLVNRGAAISSPGTVAYSEQFGTGAAASATDAFAAGRDAQASGTGATALGNGAVADKTGAFAGGNGSEATGTNSIALGSGSAADATGGVAIGRLSAVGTYHTNSAALGPGVSTTETNQIMLGTSGHKVRIPGRLEPTGTITNATFTGNTGLSVGVSGGLSGGTMTFLATRRLDNAALANGENSSVVLNGSYVKLSGPTAAFTTAGFTNSVAGNVDGQIVVVENITGYGWTIRNDSGYEQSVANRIYTGTGSDVALPGQSTATVIYDKGASRWIVVSTSSKQASYGQISTHDGATAQAIADADTYYVLTNFMTSGNYLNMTLTPGLGGSKIEVVGSGIYDCSVNLSFAGTASSTFALCVHTNGAEAVNMECETKQDVNSDVSHIGTRGILNLTTNCVVDVRVKSDSASDSITVHDGSFTLIKLQ